MTSLFRSDVVDKKVSRIEGEVLLCQPLSLTLVICLFLIFVTLCFVLSLKLNYGDYIALEGRVVASPPSHIIAVERSGLIEKMSILPGQSVTKGQPLLTVRHSDLTVSGEDRNVVEIERIKSHISQEEKVFNNKRHVLQTKASTLKEAVLLAEQEIVVLKKSLSIAKKTSKLSSDLVRKLTLSLEDNNISQREFDEALKLSLHDNQSENELSLRVIQKQQHIGEMKQQIKLLQSDEVELSVQHENNILSLVRKKEERERLLKTEIVSLTDGVVKDLIVNQGDIIDVDEILMTIVPHVVDWYVELNAPLNLKTEIREGDRVNIELASHPFSEYGHLNGVVSQISYHTKLSKNAGLNGHLRDTFRIKVDIEEFVTTNNKAVTPKHDVVVSGIIISNKKSVLDRLLMPLKDIEKVW